MPLSRQRRWQDHPLMQALLALELPTEEFAVFGSGPLFAHGLLDELHDLDLIARGRAWTQACTYGEPERGALGGQCIRIHCAAGEIEIFDSWGPGAWDIDTLIDRADQIAGIRFVPLTAVLRWKRNMGRPKDREHIRLIEAYLQT